VNAIETLSSLSRGIYPRLLSAEGLVPALRSAMSGSATPIAFETDGVGRPPAPVEAALYFCCMEAVQNAAKHAGSAVVRVRLEEDRCGWRLLVTDEGAGFDAAKVRAAGAGAGLVNMSDRLDAVGGMVSVASSPGGGTAVSALVPRAGGSDPADPGLITPRLVG
jgi:signal transduction histidine kinase